MSNFNDSSTIPARAVFRAWLHEVVTMHRTHKVYRKGRYRGLKCTRCDKVFDSVWGRSGYRYR